MKLPVSPPLREFDWILEVGDISSLSPTDERGRYLHWDKVRHLDNLDGLSPLKNWKRMKVARTIRNRQLPLQNSQGGSFVFSAIEELDKFQHWIDKNTAGGIGASYTDTFSGGESYLFNSLIEEAIHSSQLEGAATTLMQAKKMLREKRRPRSHDERMIVNNYRAMQFIRDIKKEKLTQSVIFQLHGILTKGTLPEGAGSGVFRRDEDNIVVNDQRDGVVLHTPPKAAELPRRIKALCDFANAETPKGFLHPALRAILLHFMLAYDHPFSDGNGRTARALFYWAMAHYGYWLMEYISISKIIKKRWGKYARSFLHVETDENDATYFILEQRTVIRRAHDDFILHARREVKEAKSMERALTAMLGREYNQRQVMLLKHALKHPDFSYTINGHRNAQDVSYQTARNDLLDLIDAGLLQSRQAGRKLSFYPAEGWRDKISDILKKN